MFLYNSYYYSQVVSFSFVLIFNRRERSQAFRPVFLVKTLRSRLLERLPVRLQNSEIFALNSEDHYVHIHTSKGAEMMLMRLSDAVRDSQPLDGLKVHRSWWVAKQGIEDVQKKIEQRSLD